MHVVRERDPCEDLRFGESVVVWEVALVAVGLVVAELTVWGGQDLDRGSGNEKNSLRSEATPEIGEATLSSSRASK